jgi:hypothetical protein
MRIRIDGTEEETAKAVTALRYTFQVVEVSLFYPNRRCPDTLLGRVYVETR